MYKISMLGKDSKINRANVKKMWFSVLKPFFFFNMVVFCCVEKFFCLALITLDTRGE
jgi:hypothetical protein